MIREDIYAALFALISNGVDSLTTKSRTLKHWNDVQASAMPYFCLAQGPQKVAQRTGLPPAWTLGGIIYLYTSNRGATSPGEIMNPIVDAIDAMLGIDPARGPQTLGGLCQWARIEGTIETSEGTLGSKEVAIIPVSILTL